VVASLGNKALWGSGDSQGEGPRGQRVEATDGLLGGQNVWLRFPGHKGWHMARQVTRQ
jgi:hypothetical protein